MTTHKSQLAFRYEDPKAADQVCESIRAFLRQEGSRLQVFYNIRNGNEYLIIRGECGELEELRSAIEALKGDALPIKSLDFVGTRERHGSNGAVIFI